MKSRWAAMVRTKELLDIVEGGGAQTARSSASSSAVIPQEGSSADVGPPQSVTPPSETVGEAAPVTPIVYTYATGPPASGTPPSSWTTTQGEREGLEERIGDMSPIPGAKALPRAASRAIPTTTERWQAEEDVEGSERLESVPEDTEMIHESSDEEQETPEGT